MAGYIFSLDSLDSLHLYTRNGIYSTKLSDPFGTWKTHHEGTFADYATMKEGDNVYFFIKRKIYGIGKLVNIGTDCKYFNFPGAGNPQGVAYEAIRKELLWDEGAGSAGQRCLCFFEPDPYFFEHGIDMDDVLSSNPAAFKMLRAFWKLSFVKFDDEENQAFRSVILRRNQHVLQTQFPTTGTFPFHAIHDKIIDRLSSEYTFPPGMSSVLVACANGDRLKHEMALEAGILHQLSIKHEATCKLLGNWDYLSHQVIASPFKPIDYMDKMDLFGYSYLTGFSPTKSRFLVGEIKKDETKIEDLDQLLKYVDWLRDEYCFGDYSMINAFLIAYDFDSDVVQHLHNVGQRNYTVGVRPAQSLEWNNISLIKYSLNQSTGTIELTHKG